jgi:Fe-S oxidoreductase
MIKIVFINPSMDKSLGSTIWTSKIVSVMKGGKNTFMPKLSAMILAAITPEKHSFKYIDDEIEVIDYENTDADLIAITSMSVQANHAYRIAGEFRKLGKTVVFGGIHAAVMSEEVLEHCDAIMVGESENSWPALLEDFENGNLKRIYNAKDYPPVETLVSPKVDIIKHDHYLTYPIQATRGCPNDCDFCSIQYSSGHKYRMKPVEQVVNEIREYEKYNTGGPGGALKKAYYFVDDNLYVNRSYTRALFAAMKDLNITWDGQGTVNTAFDDETLRLMAESGCRSFSFGFESVSQESLKEANKPKYNKVEEYEAAIENVQKHGIIAGGYFVFGFDSDSRQVFQDTTAFIKRANLVQSIFSILTPYPGTRLHDRIDGEERIFCKSWEFYNSWACVFTPKKMTAVELQIGSYWASGEISDLKQMRKSLKNFWKHGPWKTNPPLTIVERIVLIFLGIKLGLNNLGKYQRFLFWVAMQKNAADFKSIMWTLMRHEIVSQVPIAHIYNPADKYKK